MARYGPPNLVWSLHNLGVAPAKCCFSWMFHYRIVIDFDSGLFSSCSRNTQWPIRDDDDDDDDNASIGGSYSRKHVRSPLFVCKPFE